MVEMALDSHFENKDAKLFCLCQLPRACAHAYIQIIKYNSILNNKCYSSLFSKSWPHENWAIHKNKNNFFIKKKEKKKTSQNGV